MCGRIRLHFLPLTTKGIKARHFNPKPITMHLSRRTWGLYIIWVFIHFILWVLPKDGYGPTYREFWPFGEGGVDSYDTSEFLIYSLLPLVIIYSLKLIRNDKD